MGADSQEKSQDTYTTDELENRAARREIASTLTVILQAHSCNLRTQKLEAGRSEVQGILTTEQVQGHRGPHMRYCFNKIKKNKTEV